MDSVEVSPKRRQRFSLSQPVWRSMQRAFQCLVNERIGSALKGRSHGQLHPVSDFLFTYYSFRPGSLRRWSPGFGQHLAGAMEEDGFPSPWEREQGGMKLDPSRFPDHRVDALEWTLKLLRAIEQRPAHYQCFGLHEWAMVYRNPSQRHPDVALRMSMDAIADVVESHALCCTHFDAFRFFTPDAKIRNHLDLAPNRRVAQEQPGCLHVTMDLYKWAHKFYPWVSSNLILDVFNLAWDARTLDMRASPYDWRGLGIEPLCIESEEGRNEYQEEQVKLYELSQPLRRQLINVLEELLGHRTISSGAQP